MKNIIDIHNHLCHGVDDGSKSLTESLNYLRSFYKQGVRKMVVTPHLGIPNLRSQFEVEERLATLREAFYTLKTAASIHKDTPSLLFGQEIWAQRGGDIRRVLDYYDIGLGGSNALLVEFGFDLGLAEPEEVIDAVIGGGKQIVVAHPERYRFSLYSKPIKIVRKWVERGALLQVNSGSFLGLYSRGGNFSEKFAWTLLKQGLIYTISSDHHGDHRPQPLEEVYSLISSRAGEDTAKKLMLDNPAKLLLP